MKFFKGIDDFLKGVGVNTGILYAFLAIGFFVLVLINVPIPDAPYARYMLILLPLFLPFVMFFEFYEQWMRYIYKKFAVAQGSVTLEIRIPQEVFKTPEAMELVLMQLYQVAGPDNLVQAFIDGKSPPSYALELVSREGAVHFYINTPRVKFKNMIETHLYAQYPGIEVRELDIDYTAEVPSNLEGWGLFGFHFGKSKPIAPPMRTYVDYGHLKTPKEEEKIDPLSSMLEVLGSLGSGEQMWIQFIITANRKTSFKTGTILETPDCKKETKKLVDAILDGGEGKDKEGKTIKLKKNTQELSDDEKDTYNAILRNVGKYAFNTTIRGMYLAKGSSFNGQKIALLAAILRSYDAPGRGVSFPPAKFKTDVDWPWWQNIGGKTVAGMKLKLLKLYKLRAVDPFSDNDTDTVLTTEELATFWHIPGATITTPTLGRIESTRREAPSNLPI